MKAILRAYGLWLAGVLSAAAAAYFLYRSRAITYELEDELAHGEDLRDRLAKYAPGHELED